MKRYVIIGNSIAAAGAVEGIRQMDKEGEITVIGAESHPVYSRPLISYLLQGKTDRQKMLYRDSEFYCKNGCNVLLSNRALSIDPAAKTVLTDQSGIIPYDKLLIATGSSPFIPPMDGLLKVKEKHTFYTLDDALGLEKCLEGGGKKVLIVGAGLIGLKCAEGIHKKCSSITVVDLAPRILSSILDEETAEYVKQHLEKAGIAFRLGVSVKEFSENAALLTDGTAVPFDTVVLAIGVRPNVSLLKDAGGAVGRGIVTDLRQKTSLEDVYAAGDCTESIDVSSGKTKILALLPCAYMQGETAGINMAGGSKLYDRAVPMNAMGLFGLHLITAGSYEGECYVDREGGYKKLFHDKTTLKGYILINNIDKAGIYTSMISEKIPLQEIDFELVCRQPGLMAFSGEKRKEKLGGVER